MAKKRCYTIDVDGSPVRIQADKPPDEKVAAMAAEIYRMIYNTPREVIEEMAERQRELRRPRNPMLGIHDWRAGE